MKSLVRNSSHIRSLIGRLWPLLVVAIAVGLCSLGGDSARLGLRYDNAALAGGEWWRLVSGHLVHLGWSHTLLNLAGLGLVALLFPDEYSARQWLLLVLVCIAGISAGFLLLRPDLGWYVGLSGVLHGLFAAGAIKWISQREVEGFVLAAFLTGKLIWEQVYGALPMSVASSGGPVVVDAHLYGAVTGTLAAVLLLRDWRGGRR